MLRPVEVIKVQDAYRNKQNFEYVGRYNKTYGLEKSPLANPYKDGPREELVGNFKIWLYHILQKHEESSQKTELRRLYGEWIKNKELKLGCWCFPKICHADTIKELLEKKAIKEGYKIEY